MMSAVFCERTWLLSLLDACVGKRIVPAHFQTNRAISAARPENVPEGQAELSHGFLQQVTLRAEGMQKNRCGFAAARAAAELIFADAFGRFQNGFSSAA